MKKLKWWTNIIKTFCCDCVSAHIVYLHLQVWQNKGLTACLLLQHWKYRRLMPQMRTAYSELHMCCVKAQTIVSTVQKEARSAASMSSFKAEMHPQDLAQCTLADTTRLQQRSKVLSRAGTIFARFWLAPCKTVFCVSQLRLTDRSFLALRPCQLIIPTTVQGFEQAEMALEGTFEQCLQLLHKNTVVLNVS